MVSLGKEDGDSVSQRPTGKWRVYKQVESYGRWIFLSCEYMFYGVVTGQWFLKTIISGLGRPHGKLEENRSCRPSYETSHYKMMTHTSSACNCNDGQPRNMEWWLPSRGTKNMKLKRLQTPSMESQLSAENFGVWSHSRYSIKIH